MNRLTRKVQLFEEIQKAPVNIVNQTVEDFNICVELFKERFITNAHQSDAWVINNNRKELRK